MDEIEAAGMVPKLVHARKAKLMMGQINKTDKLDARGLNLLQRNKTLPTVWIPPGELRDQRDLPRTRMVLVAQKVQLKNRIHATLAKYGLSVGEVSDAFGVEGQRRMRELLVQLPPHTRYATERVLEELGKLDEQIESLEKRMQEVFREIPEMQLVRSLPGVGFILGIVIPLEVGSVDRFGSAEKLAAYAGTVPRVHASGGKARYGSLRPDANRYLKWAFIEAANAISIHRKKWPERHVCRLYERIRQRKGHQKAAGAVARHLAEATYWILTKREPYKEPQRPAVSSTGAQARLIHERLTLGS